MIKRLFYFEKTIDHHVSLLSPVCQALLYWLKLGEETLEVFIWSRNLGSSKC